MEIDALKYPIGKFTPQENVGFEEIQSFVKEIEYFPSALRAMVANLDEEQLEWKYRPDGWNIRQVVHHCSDSHLNAFCRFKLALTEDTPQIRPYKEDRWAELSDCDAPISFSLDLLENLHVKWTYLLRGMDSNAFERQYFHPESKTTPSLYEVTMMYSWHGNHHLAHIKQAIESEGKYN